MCCVEPAVATQALTALREQGLVRSGLFRAQSPIELFSDPVYRTPALDGTRPQSAEYFEFVVHTIRDSAKPSQKHKTMSVFSVTARGAEVAGGVLPKLSDDVERDLNVTAMVVTAHWLVLRGTRYILPTTDVVLDGVVYPPMPMLDPDQTPAIGRIALLRAPESGRQQTADYPRAPGGCRQ